MVENRGEKESPLVIAADDPKMMLGEEDKCPECKGRIIMTDGALVCERCGLVQERIYDRGVSRIAFTEEERENRSTTGPPMTMALPDKGLSTTIQESDISRLKHSRIGYAKMLRRTDNISKMGWKIKRFIIFKTELERMGSLIGSPKPVIEHAIYLYRTRVVNSDVVRGRMLRFMADAVLWLAHKNGGYPRSLDEIAEHIDLPEYKELPRNRYVQVVKKVLWDHCKVLVNELGIDKAVSQPREFIPQLATGLKLSQAAQHRAIEILKMFTEKGITAGKDPLGLAASALYIAAYEVGERRTQRKIAETAGITEVTLRNRYQEIAEVLEIDIVVYGKQPI